MQETQVSVCLVRKVYLPRVSTNPLADQAGASPSLSRLEMPSSGRTNHVLLDFLELSIALTVLLKEKRGRISSLILRKKKFSLADSPPSTPCEGTILEKNPSFEAAVGKNIERAGTLKSHRDHRAALLIQISRKSLRLIFLCIFLFAMCIHWFRVNN